MGEIIPRGVERAVSRGDRGSEAGCGGKKYPAEEDKPDSPDPRVTRGFGTRAEALTSHVVVIIFKSDKMSPVYMR
jgi:hypothetical protein